MPSSIEEQKGLLRRQTAQRLAALSQSEQRESDDALFARFLALPEVAAARTVFAFWGVPGREPDTARLVRALIARGKAVGLPRMLPGRGMEVRRYDPEVPLVPAAFGISEPGEDSPIIPKAEIGLALVPAMCYDRRGFRLGFGGGYYDRWLADFTGVTAGLCRGAVLRERVPVEGHDSRVDILITEGESLSFR